MVTPHHMREFASDCMRWSIETENASQRDIIVRLATVWTNTANYIDRQVAEGATAFPDLRNKLD
jgi:hypothetical protein